MLAYVTVADDNWLDFLVTREIGKMRAIGGKYVWQDSDAFWVFALPIVPRMARCDFTVHSVSLCVIKIFFIRYIILFLGIFGISF